MLKKIVLGVLLLMSMVGVCNADYNIYDKRLIIKTNGDIQVGTSNISFEAATNYLYGDGSKLTGITGGGGTTNHAALSNLDYATANHTGFASSLSLATYELTASLLNRGYATVSQLNTYETQSYANATYFKLNQSSPQSVVGGAPTFDALAFNTGVTTPFANAEGLLQWNATDGTLDLGMQAGAITMQLGQELFAKVRNAQGATIENGKVVYIFGRTGVYPDVKLAISNAESTSTAIGVATEDILDSGSKFGYVTTYGYVRGIKTNYTGSGVWGTDWVAGDKLYVSKTVSGELTNIEPTAPHHADVVATVGVVGANGSILVGVERHKTLEELTDVNGTALTTTGQFPVWTTTSNEFDFNYNINNYATLTNLGTFETTQALLNRSYITATSLSPYATLTGLSTYELTANVISKLNTFETTQSLLSRGYIAGNQTITITGDATGTGATNIPLAVNKTRLNVRNETGVAIATTKAVYVSGFNNLPLVGLVMNTDEAKHNMIGITVGSIANSANGYIATGGQFDAETNLWNVGEELYISLNGNLTNVEPTAGTVRHAGIVTVKANYPTGKIVLYTQPEEYVTGMTVGSDYNIRMGDSVGVNKVSFKNYANVEVASLNSLGQLSTPTLSTFELTSSVNAKLNTFETTSALIARNYITASSLSPYATLTGLATYELTANVISKLNTFETISAHNSSLSSYSTTTAMNTAIATAMGTVELLSRKGIANGYASLDALGKIPTSEAYYPTGGTGGGTWGSITGTLGNQTDLNNALATFEQKASKGVANGYAALNSEGKVTGTQIKFAGNMIITGDAQNINLLALSTSSETYAQINLKNTSPRGSGDLVVTADNGNETTNYLDLGLNNSAYSNSQYSITNANDGYLYVHGGSLEVGTASANKAIIFHTGGTLATNEVARMTTQGMTVAGTLDAIIRESKSISITNPTATADAAVWRVPSDITIEAVHVLCRGNVVVGQVSARDTNGNNPVDIDGTDITGLVDTNVTDTGFSSPRIPKGYYLGWETASVTGTPTYVFITVDYYRRTKP